MHKVLSSERGRGAVREGEEGGMAGVERRDGGGERESASGRDREGG